MTISTDALDVFLVWLHDTLTVGYGLAVEQIRAVFASENIVIAGEPFDGVLHAELGAGTVATLMTYDLLTWGEDDFDFWTPRPWPTAAELFA